MSDASPDLFINIIDHHLCLTGNRKYFDICIIARTVFTLVIQLVSHPLPTDDRPAKNVYAHVLIAGHLIDWWHF
jgi:hypothetical protein